jgi:RND superfamily putative drug exporter
VERYKSNNNNGGFWAKWSKLVMKRPITFLIIGILFMTPFIGLSLQTELSFSFVNSLPPGTQSREGFQIIHDNFDLGQLYPYNIIIDGKTNNSIWNSNIINQSNALGLWAMNYEGLEGNDGEMVNFSSATSLSFTTNKTSREVDTMSLEAMEALMNGPDGTGWIDEDDVYHFNPNYEKFAWIETSKQYINWDVANNTLVISITANIDAGSAIAWQLVDVIREKVTEFFGDLDVDTYVSGFAPSFKDSSDSLYGDVPKMLLVATTLIFLALMVLFRSILLPIKAILTISGSILVGLGSLVFIFQHGNLLDITILNFQIWSAEQAGIAFIIPVFLFTTILGLGMDYSIFIISRIKEEHGHNGNELGESVGIGLSKTAGVVTSAASIMIATFMVFATSPMLIMKSMGLAMAVAIFVDATISRIIILPAAMKIAGRWNFWLPKWLDKILPKIDLEH